ncbi:sugar transferase [Planktomarina sp.]|nr:sugar transferase [Planktomarina sp.]
MERICDILLAGLALIILSPLVLPVIIVLRITGEGEVFFLQERVGKDFKTFKLYKFATMLKESPNLASGTITIKDDPRVLPIGKILRKIKINELPQLVNVVLGDMSLIGPRPLTEQTFKSYAQKTQNVTTKVKPGLSGLGSIIFRSEESILHDGNDSVQFYDDTIAPYKGAVEEWFVYNKSLYYYFLIIFITIWVVLFPESKIVWRTFKNMPVPPEQLKSALNYCEY